MLLSKMVILVSAENTGEIGRRSKQDMHIMVSTVR